MILQLLVIILGMVSATGNVIFEGNVRSEALQTNRLVRVFVPPGYQANKTARYPVLYVHDGQNVFSTVGPNVAFGWGNWALDTTAERLISEGKMEPIIIVAIDCGPSRYREYRGPIAAGADNRAYERYAEFLAAELKPKIDREYRTQPDAAHTGLLGSSMGGVCSVALAWERPNIFGLAASLSGAFQVEKQYFLEQVLKSPSARKKPIRIYLDSGISDYTGGDDGLKQTEAVRNALDQLGWKQGKDLLHVVDNPLTAEELAPMKLAPEKFKEAQRSQHNELYWRVRVWRALTFLFPPVSPTN